MFGICLFKHPSHVDFAFLQARPTDPRRRNDVTDNLPPWTTNAPTIEITIGAKDSASSIADHGKRDAAGTLLVDVALSDASHGDSKPVECTTHNAAIASSRPTKDFFWGVRVEIDDLLCENQVKAADNSFSFSVIISMFEIIYCCRCPNMCFGTPIYSYWYRTCPDGGRCFQHAMPSQLLRLFTNPSCY